MALSFSVQAGTAAGPLDQVLTLLQDFGFFRVVLPFLLIFAIVYAILLKTEVLGDPATSSFAKSASAIVALVVGFLVIAYTPVIDALATLLPQAGFVLVLIVLILMVLGMFGITFAPKAGERFPPWAAGIAIIVFILFLAIVGYAAPQIEPLHMLAMGLMGQIPFELTDETIALLIGISIVLAIVGGVIYLVTRS